MSWDETGRRAAPRARRARRVGAALLAVAIGGSAALVTAAVPAQAAPVAVVSGSADWGLKASFRSYVTGPIAQGAIAVSNGATTNGDGTFHFVNGSGTVDTTAVSVAFGGTLHFTGHAGALDMVVEDLHITRSGSTGTIVADVTSKSLSTGVTDTYPDVSFATLDYTGVTPSVVGTSTTYTGVPAALTADGAASFAGFYGTGTALDPITFTVASAPVPVWTPAITVSKSTGIDPLGETVTVSGTGFNPTPNISTRPPVPVGMPTGVYVVFGRFADTWKPSAGAPSSARKVIDQKWALPAASKSAAEAAFGPNPQYVVLAADGSFTTTLHVAPNDTFTGNYGVYTYAAGGAAANASQETATPMAFQAPTGTDAAVTIPPFTVRGQFDTSRFKVTVSNVDVTPFTVSAADLSVAVKVNGVPVADPITSLTPTVRKIKPTLSGGFTYEWAHGDSLQAGDVVTVTACVHVPNDDGPNNSCSSTVSPNGAVDLTAGAPTSTQVVSKRASSVLVAPVTNAGAANVLLRSSNVHVQVYVNDVLSTGALAARLPATTRALVKPTVTKNYAFTWSHPALHIGDVVRVETCVPVPGDVTAANDCNQQTFTVIK